MEQFSVVFMNWKSKTYQEIHRYGVLLNDSLTVNERPKWNVRGTAELVMAEFTPECEYLFTEFGSQKCLDDVFKALQASPRNE